MLAFQNWTWFEEWSAFCSVVVSLLSFSAAVWVAVASIEKEKKTIQMWEAVVKQYSNIGNLKLTGAKIKDGKITPEFEAKEVKND